jgi:hypothetical protein
MYSAINPLCEDFASQQAAPAKQTAATMAIEPPTKQLFLGMSLIIFQALVTA